MDVITVLQPENHVLINKNTKTITKFLPKEDFSPVFENQNTKEVYGFFFSYPIIFSILCLTFVLSIPFMQNRVGGYRLGQISFSSDNLIENYLRNAVSEQDSSILEKEGLGTDLSFKSFSVEYKNYTVKSGETISSIISRFGLKNISTLLSVNGIDNARRIKSGQILKIPSMDGLIYTVMRGDTISKIAQKYSLSITALLDVNDLDSETLVLGQKLFIPGATLSTYELRKALGELFIMPINGRLTSNYGTRNDPFTGVKSFHTGIDLAAPTGTIIKAALDGKVAATGYSSVYGNYAIISHDGGYQTLYGHMSAISCKKGQTIVQGGRVGLVGNTGYSTGSHLHFTVYKNGKTIDPFSVLK